MPSNFYESILIWLARSRETREGRESADRCLQLVQQLALAMQTSPEGRRVQMDKGEAAEKLTSCFPSHAHALDFLEQELVRHHVAHVLSQQLEHPIFLRREELQPHRAAWPANIANCGNAYSILRSRTSGTILHAGGGMHRTYSSGKRSLKVRR